MYPYIHTCMHTYIHVCMHIYMNGVKQLTISDHGHSLHCIHVCIHTYIHTWMELNNSHYPIMATVCTVFPSPICIVYVCVYVCMCVCMYECNSRTPFTSIWCQTGNMYTHTYIWMCVYICYLRINMYGSALYVCMYAVTFACIRLYFMCILMWLYIYIYIYIYICSFALHYTHIHTHTWYVSNTREYIHASKRARTHKRSFTCVHSNHAP